MIMEENGIFWASAWILFAVLCVLGTPAMVALAVLTAFG